MAVGVGNGKRRERERRKRKGRKRFGSLLLLRLRASSKEGGKVLFMIGFARGAKGIGSDVDLQEKFKLAAAKSLV